MTSSIHVIRTQLMQSKHRLLNLQHVVATGIGYKTVAGKETADLAIICSVEEKKPKNRIRKSDLVPPFIRNIPTDVQPVGRIHAFRHPSGRFRPVPGGVSAGHCRVNTGTLGCLVKKNGVSYILSNNHVLADCNKASIHDPILQPGRDDGGKNPFDQIAELSAFLPLRFLEEKIPDKQKGKLTGWMNNFLKKIGFRSSEERHRQPHPDAINLADCAIALPVNPEDVVHKIREIGCIQGVSSGELGMSVKKSGRTTGLTTDRIKQVDVCARVHYGQCGTALFAGQLMAGSMSRYGDSGSAVLDDQNNLTGLLFAGSEKITLINPIEHVFDALEIDLV